MNRFRPTSNLTLDGGSLADVIEDQLRRLSRPNFSTRWLRHACPEIADATERQFGDAMAELAARRIAAPVHPSDNPRTAQT